MPKRIDYYFTLISPWTYLGSARFEDMARRHGAEIRVLPVDYGRIFPVSGGLPLAKRAKQRRDYRLVELARWRAYRAVPLNMHPAHFPTDVRLASGVVIAARSSGQDALKLAHAMMRAVWVEERDLADRATLVDIAKACGLDGASLLAAAERPEADAAFEADTTEAIERGVFGAPAYLYDGEMFWGQDRLEFLDQALAAR